MKEHMSPNLFPNSKHDIFIPILINSSSDQTQPTRKNDIVFTKSKLESKSISTNNKSDYSYKSKLTMQSAQ